MAITIPGLGILRKDRVVIGKTSSGYLYPYVVQAGSGGKIFQPGTRGGIITNAYPRTIIGTTNIHRFSNYNNVSNLDVYFTTAATIISGSSAYPSNFGLPFDHTIRIPTETRALDTQYSFQGNKPLDISVVTRTSIWSSFKIGSSTYRATGWRINNVAGTSSKYLDACELWVFIRAVEGASIPIRTVYWPRIDSAGNYSLLSVGKYKEYTFNNKLNILYTAEMASPGSYPFIGMPIIQLNSVASVTSNVMECQYMLCLKNST